MEKKSSVSPGAKEFLKTERGKKEISLEKAIENVDSVIDSRVEKSIERGDNAVEGIKNYSGVNEGDITSANEVATEANAEIERLKKETQQQIETISTIENLKTGVIQNLEASLSIKLPELIKKLPELSDEELDQVLKEVQVVEDTMYEAQKQSNFNEAYTKARQEIHNQIGDIDSEKLKRDLSKDKVKMEEKQKKDAELLNKLSELSDDELYKMYNNKDSETFYLSTQDKIREEINKRESIKQNTLLAKTKRFFEIAEALLAIPANAFQSLPQKEKEKIGRRMSGFMMGNPFLFDSLNKK